MEELAASDILQVWERGWDRSPSAAVQLLLAAAYPEAPPEALQALTFGQRDALLLSLRTRLFGSRLEGVTDCPACGERLELSFQAEDVLPPSLAPETLPPPAREPLEVEISGCRLVFRLPVVADLKPGPPEQSLLERCLLSAKRDGQALAAADLPAVALAAIEEQMEAADPGAEVWLTLACPACGHAWPAVFDIASYLWNEIHTWAQRLLLEVHALARAYGWSEAEILALSPLRRQLYLNLVGAVT